MSIILINLLCNQLNQTTHKICAKHKRWSGILTTTQRYIWNAYDIFMHPRVRAHGSPARTQARTHTHEDNSHRNAYWSWIKLKQTKTTLLFITNKWQMNNLTRVKNLPACGHRSHWKLLQELNLCNNKIKAPKFMVHSDSHGEFITTYSCHIIAQFLPKLFNSFNTLFASP